MTYYYWSALIWFLFNVAFVLYYFTIKKWLDNRDPNREYGPINQDRRSLSEVLVGLTA